MCKQIFVVNEYGAGWEDASTIEGSLEPAQESIGDYMKHIEDSSVVERKMPQKHDRYTELMNHIDITLMKISNMAKDNKGSIPGAWLNLIWNLNYDEQRLLLRKWGMLASDRRGI